MLRFPLILGHINLYLSLVTQLIILSPLFYDPFFVTSSPGQIPVILHHSILKPQIPSQYLLCFFFFFPGLLKSLQSGACEALSDQGIAVYHTQGLHIKVLSGDFILLKMTN